MYLINCEHVEDNIFENTSKKYRIILNRFIDFFMLVPFVRLKSKLPALGFSLVGCILGLIRSVVAKEYR